MVEQREIHVSCPEISVIIPTHDRANLLRDAVESVLRSPLIVSPEQIIVVDDDSHDETGEVARQFGTTYVRVACHSSAGSRNVGLRLAQTPYVTFLDDDDVWLPGNMEAQLVALKSHPDAGLAYGIAQCATEALEPLPWTWPSPPLPSGFIPARFHLNYTQLGVVLFRRTAACEAGGFDPRIRYYEDADLMLRVASRNDIIGVDLVGMLYRVRPPSKARSDYFWAQARREVTRWRPRHVGVDWKTAAKFRFKTRGLFFWRFHDDAVASMALGHRQDALICLSRALWVSPAHAFRHSRAIGSSFWLCISGRPPRHEGAVMF